jgi:hypothetical protein
MWRRLTIPLLFFCSAFSSKAQRVLYSPDIGNKPATRFEVIGKAGDYYWVQKSKTKHRYKKITEPWLDDTELRFEVYDTRMNLVNTIPSLLSDSIIKEYLVPGDDFFDQLIFKPYRQNVLLLLNRYTADGNFDKENDTLSRFPGDARCGDFILVRSQDKSKILLLCFENIPDSPPKTIAMLYDKNWNLLCQNEYANANISKPLVQYDIVDYPLEDYSSASIKLYNNGEWCMVVSSRKNRNYLLFHFNGTDDRFVYKEIKLSSSLTVEDAGLYTDNETGQGFAGILSRIRTPAIKNIRLVHYSMNDFKIDFDTSYYFNTLAKNKTRNENMFEEYFMIVPRKGFLFLKEYGRSFSPDENSGINTDDVPVNDIKNIVNNETPEPINKDEYTRYDNLAGTRNNFDRGDLTLYYFPAHPNDSCWSGIINKEQTTDLGTSYLSYVFLPQENKLFFLYNSLYGNNNEFSSTTVLDEKGNALNDGIEYWKIKNTLVFQKARQIAANELAIPYQRNAKNGFAIIRL